MTAYSSRSARTGSTRLARQAGSQPARRATAPRMVAAAATVIGSSGCTSYNVLRMAVSRRTWRCTSQRKIAAVGAHGRAEANLLGPLAHGARPDNTRRPPRR